MLFHLISKTLTTSSNARNYCLFLKKKAVRWPVVQEIHLSDLEHIKLRRDWLCQVYVSSHNLKSRGFVIPVGAFISLPAFTWVYHTCMLYLGVYTLQKHTNCVANPNIDCFLPILLFPERVLNCRNFLLVGFIWCLRVLHPLDKDFTFFSIPHQVFRG